MYKLGAKYERDEWDLSDLPPKVLKMVEEEKERLRKEYIKKYEIAAQKLRKSTNYMEEGNAFSEMDNCVREEDEKLLDFIRQCRRDLQPKGSEKKMIRRISQYRKHICKMAQDLDAMEEEYLAIIRNKRAA